MRLSIYAPNKLLDSLCRHLRFLLIESEVESRAFPDLCYVTLETGIHDVQNAEYLREVIESNDRRNTDLANYVEVRKETGR